MAEFAERDKINENRTGIPTRLKERMELRTGYICLKIPVCALIR